MAVQIALTVVNRLAVPARSTGFLTSLKKGLGIASLSSTICSDLFGRSFSAASHLMGRTHVDWKAKGDVAVVYVNDPKSKVNRWSSHMQKEMMEVMDEIWTNDSVGSAVVMSSKPNSYITGIDLKTVLDCETEKEIARLSLKRQKILKLIECSPKPIVAAIDGWCLNAGLEFAMACQYRVATRNIETYFGSQEVMLGLMPSAGGTQGLTKLIGPVAAIDYMTSAKLIRADLAKQIGLVHDVVKPMHPSILETIAIGFARGIAKKRIPLISQSNGMLKPEDYHYSFPAIRNKMYRDMWELHLDLKAPTHAHQKIIHTVKAGMEQGSEAGYRAEAQNFGALAMTRDTKDRIRWYQRLLPYSMW
ncbi:trifunctional enzyme subunit alpha, mitochondrial-like [Astyanax mexicanus]|uniref:trifunctional enzyme subunit alpha, mitochondrial-like n=1 Tax=Astyanax mexicanus TaxID=7994 RepID=UPI0020CAEB3F|nr:trifunctional enzyme subunit alpha, mitochondrial-like [Astyanax mexicanus]